MEISGEKMLNWDKNSTAETGDGDGETVPGSRWVRQKSVGVRGGC